MYELKIQALIEKEKRDVNVNFKMGAKGMCFSTTLDDVFQKFFKSQLTIDACLSADHKTNFSFSLGCLWNVQIQF